MPIAADVCNGSQPRPTSPSIPSRFFLAGGFHGFPGGFRERGRSLNSPAPRSHWPPSMTTHSPLMYWRHIAEEECGEIGEFFVAAEALHGIGICCACSSNCFEGHEARPGAFGGKRAGGDGVEANFVFAPTRRRANVVMARTPALAQAEGTTKPEPQFAAA